MRVGNFEVTRWEGYFVYREYYISTKDGKERQKVSQTYLRWSDFSRVLAGEGVNIQELSEAMDYLILQEGVEWGKVCKARRAKKEAKILKEEGSL